jgi:hypothetical protein
MTCARLECQMRGACAYKCTQADKKGATKGEIRARAEEAVKNLLVVECMKNCQRSTVGAIIIALEAAGLEIVEKRDNA